MSLTKKVLKKVYMVTLNSKDDLDDFYDDMQTEGGALYIPDRAITVNNQRPNSRTTEYWLTEYESNIVRNDSRVKAVELNPSDRGIEVDEFDIIEQNGTYARNSGTTNSDLNWGLLRLLDGNLRGVGGVIKWGTTNYTEVTDTIEFNATGRNVDLIICDGNGVYTGHPEYDQPSAQETDDGSATRLNQINWNQFQSDIGAPDTYTYSSPGSYHANHVMGTAGGNRQGWARDANLYNLYYYAGDINNNNFPYVFEYIKEFHEQKAVNSETGYKNPTVVNNSWGMSIFPNQWTFNSIDAVTYRGTRFTPNGDSSYNGRSGVFSSTAELATFTADPEDISQRITTAGSEGNVNGDFNSIPTGFVRTGGQIELDVSVIPNTPLTATIQGPATINYKHNVSTQGLTGISIVDLTVTVNDASDTTVNTQTDSQTSVDGGIAEVDLVQSNLSLPNNEVYSITFETTVTEGTDPTTEGLLKCTLVGYSGGDATATVTSLGTDIAITTTAGLTASSSPTVGNNDDGYWTITLPFNATYLGESSNTVYLGTNSYLTFGSGSSVYSGIDENTPSLPKIMVTAEDCSAQRIFYGASGSVGSRIFRLIYEGSAGTSGTLGSPTVRYEYKFYEATPAQIDLTIENNANKTVDGNFTTSQLNSWGFIASQRIPLRVAALDADIEDAIDSGVITIGAAGNGRWKHDVPGGPDWDNTFEMNGVTYYYMRGTSPTANDNDTDGDYDIPNICVGATDVSIESNLDRKVSFSDCGPGVDIYAPGTSIIAPHNSGSMTDPRNSSFRISKISGTSMASPQVAGLVACLMETYPHYNQEQVKAYLISKWAEEDQLFDGTGGPTDFQDLQGSPNVHAKYTFERPLTGPAYPKKDYNLRPTTGAQYPRPKRSVIKRQPE